jgi:hypothetical protein
MTGGLTARVTGGGRDWIPLLNGKSLKSEPTHFDGVNPAVRVHAVLGALTERKTHHLEQITIVYLIPFYTNLRRYNKSTKFLTYQIFDLPKY